jgi:hypothetical protein
VQGINLALRVISLLLEEILVIGQLKILRRIQFCIDTCENVVDFFTDSILEVRQLDLAVIKQQFLTY